MYYLGYHSGTAPLYGNYSYPNRYFEGKHDLEQQVENLQRQLEELRDRFDLVQTESRHEQTNGEEVEELDQSECLEEQFVTLRSDQITAFQHLLSTLLNSEASERIINIQIEGTTEEDTRDVTDK